MEILENYFKFIKECKNKNYSGGTHTHHIIPKHMGGTNDINNLIVLDYKDHQKAHIILADCFDIENKYYKSNIYSANLLNRWVNCDDENLLNKLSLLKTIQLIEWWANISEIELIKYKNKLSSSMKKMWQDISEDKLKIRNNKISNSLKGRIITWKDKIRKNHADFSGKNNPMYKKNHLSETKIKISLKLKGNPNLGGRKNKTFSSFKFYLNNEFIAEINGQKNAKEFCQKNNISFQMLCKKNDTWKLWKCIRNKKQ